MHRQGEVKKVPSEQMHPDGDIMDLSGHEKTHSPLESRMKPGLHAQDEGPTCNIPSAFAGQDIVKRKELAAVYLICWSSNDICTLMILAGSSPPSGPSELAPSGPCFIKAPFVKQPHVTPLFSRPSNPFTLFEVVGMPFKLHFSFMLFGGNGLNLYGLW